MLVRLTAAILTIAAMLGSVFAQALSMGFERDRGKTMLRTIKSDLQKNYYDPAFRGMDLEAAFQTGREPDEGSDVSESDLWNHRSGTRCARRFPHLFRAASEALQDRVWLEDADDWRQVLCRRS